MTTKQRLLLWGGFLVVATIFALANHGWQYTWPALAFFYALGIGYNGYLYFKAKRQ